MSNNKDEEEKGSGAILPERIGEDGLTQSDHGTASDLPDTPGDREPEDKRGRQYPKTDGNPNVTGDVRST